MVFCNFFRLIFLDWSPTFVDLILYFKPSFKWPFAVQTRFLNVNLYEDKCVLSRLEARIAQWSRGGKKLIKKTFIEIELFSQNFNQGSKTFDWLALDWNKLLKYLELTAIFLSHPQVILKTSSKHPQVIWSNLIQF